jgi:redox-regulated HSP33 family molecular chaperone
MKTLLLAVAVVLVAACVATAILAPSLTGGVCVDTQLDQEQRELMVNLSGSGEMKQTVGVQCRSLGQSGS